MTQIYVNQRISIDSSELIEKFVRSSGPGGQNVNKVSTAVQLRFDIANSPSLPERVRTKLLTSGDTRITKDGELVLFAESKRTQESNRRDAIERLKAIIRDAAFIPKVRRPTKPTAGSVKRRLESKAKRSQTKKKRSGKIDFD